LTDGGNCPAPPLFLFALAQAHVELLTNPDNCGSLSSSNLDEHGLGENRYNCYTFTGVPGETNCYNAEDAMETLCERSPTSLSPALAAVIVQFVEKIVENRRH